MKAFCSFVLLFLITALAFAKQEPAKNDNKTETPVQSVRRISIKSGELSKKLVYKVNARYPRTAMDQRVSGVVVLRVVVGVDGKVKDVEYVSGPQILVQSTVEAVRQYKYKPTTDNGAFDFQSTPRRIEPTLKGRTRREPGFGRAPQPHPV